MSKIVDTTKEEYKNVDFYLILCNVFLVATHSVLCVIVVYKSQARITPHYHSDVTQRMREGEREAGRQAGREAGRE